MGAHPVNRTSLREIEASAFAVCLDDNAPTDHLSQTRGLLHGDGMNRWYDKNLEFIVCENGKAGFMGEVSCHRIQPGHAVVPSSPTWVCTCVCCTALGDGRVTHCLHDQLGAARVRNAPADTRALPL